MADWSPTATDVAGQLAGRLDGRPFSTDTYPTVAQVADIITSVADEVEAEASIVGTIPIDLHALAKRAALLGVARDVERIFFPEQNPGGDTQSDELDRLHRSAMDRLLEAMRAAANRDGESVGAFTISTMPAEWPWETLNTLDWT